MTQIVTDIYANPPVAWFLVDIWFVMPPNKIVYKSGESFDPTGLQVQAIYNNNLREMVTNYTYYPTGALVDGDKTVTISYTDGEITKTRGITITVQPILVGVEVTTMPTKTVYTYGETPDYTGMVVTATYSDGTSAEVTGYITTNTTLSTLGSVGLTVSYTEDGITFTDDVPITVGPATIATVPTQSGSLTYNGNAQSPTWSGYDSNQLTLEGSISEANAGTYTVSFTPKYGFCWAGGGDSTQSTTWSISKAQIGSMPAQNGSLTYNGSAQIPTWSNYDTSQLTMDGNTSGTNAGTYTVSFTPTANYMWSDSTTEAKNATWSIAKAPTILTISVTSVEITANNNPATFTITSNRDTGVIGCEFDYNYSSENNPFGTIGMTTPDDNDDIATLSIEGLENVTEASIIIWQVEDDNFLPSEPVVIPITVSLSSLPSGYEEIEYIQSGAQIKTGSIGMGPYIKTEMVPTNTTKIEVTFACVGKTGGRVFGSSGNNQNGHFVLLANETDIVVFFTAFTRRELTRNASLGEVHTVILDATNNTAQLDNETPISLPYDDSTPLGAGPQIGLFCEYIDDNRPFYTGDIRIYSCKIWQNGLLVRDFVPVIETLNTNNVAMYDKSSNQLFTNEGFGHFLSPYPYDYNKLLPNDYIRLEYISNPNGGYINSTLNNVLQDVTVSNGGKKYTLPAINQTRKCKIEFISNNSQPTTGEVPLLGFLYYQKWRASASSSRYYYKSYANELLYYSKENSFGFRYGYSTANIYGKTVQKISNPSGILEITLSNEQQKFAINDTEVSLSAYGDSTTTYQSYIGGIFGTSIYYSTTNNATPSSKQYGSYTANYKLYYYYIGNAGLAYLYFIPCINPEGVVGLYEVINGQFYSSYFADKPFVAGPAV